MLGKIISQLYRIADLLKDKKLVDKDSSDNNDSSEDKPKEITLDDIYQYYKSQLELLYNNALQESLIDPFPETFDDIEFTETNLVDKIGIYKADKAYREVLFSYLTDTNDETNVRCYVCFLGGQDISK